MSSRQKVLTFANPFKEKGNWYKGVLHVHTTKSDGVLSPEEHALIYQKNGYHFLNFADHNWVTNIDMKGKILILPGSEISAENDKYHLVAINFNEEINQEKFSKFKVQQIIDYVKERSGEIILAHPYFSSLMTQEVINLENILGIEVFNSSVLLYNGKGNNEIYWDMALEKGKRLLGFASDDSHYHFNEHRPLDTGYSRVIVKSSSLTKSALMESLREGLFYSSCGPEFKELEIQKESIYVKTSPVSSITFIANGMNSGKRFASPKRKLIKKAEYKIKGNEHYVRIQCEDRLSRGAWLNPIFIEE